MDTVKVVCVGSKTLGRGIVTRWVLQSSTNNYYVGKGPLWGMIAPRHVKFVPSKRGAHTWKYGGEAIMWCRNHGIIAEIK